MTLHLRRNAAFHDGKPRTPADVAVAIMAIPASASPRRSVGVTKGSIWISPPSRPHIRLDKAGSRLVTFSAGASIVGGTGFTIRGARVVTFLTQPIDLEGRLVAIRRDDGPELGSQTIALTARLRRHRADACDCGRLNRPYPLQFGGWAERLIQTTMGVWVWHPVRPLGDRKVMLDRRMRLPASAAWRHPSPIGRTNLAMAHGWPEIQPVSSPARGPT